ncbi:MAG: response regulator [Lachnospiraceae bacterium]|nr:response regulator [Lachnospiraceae bacterium]
MEHQSKNNALFQASHLMILMSYTLFSAVLVGEALLLDWEKWAIPIIVTGVITAWIMHATQSVPEYYRIWFYSIFMMLTFFFYGIHVTSMFDIAAVMAVVIMLYSMTGIPALIVLCVGTYCLTMGYDVAVYCSAGEPVDSLMVTRTLLHFMLITMAGWAAGKIINKWGLILRRSEEEIRELTEATHRVDDFLANVSHEIRTPINAVIGLSTVMKDKTVDPDLLGDIGAITDAGQRVAEQIGDILDYTEIDMKKLAVTGESYMIISLVNDLIAQVRLLMQPNVELILDVDAGIPSVLVGDAVKIRKILWHLIANGLKFTRYGGVYVRLCAANRDYGINLCIEVTDTGVGMENEEIERALERFYQGDSGRSRNVGGLGLGLPIVSGFAESMGGFFTIQSEPGKGTRACVSIPQNVADATPCMSVENRQNLCAATFLRFERFDVPQIREFYHDLIMHIGKELHFPIMRVNELEDLKRLRDNYQLTHLFIGAQEYAMDPDYVEALAETVEVVVVADASFRAPDHSAVRILRKPVSSFPIANILNNLNMEGSDQERTERMYCPGVRALVVDDERMNLMVAEGIFKSYGMEVTTVTSGPEAIRTCKLMTFDVVFMDHMMPEMDGVEAMKHIRADAGKRGSEMVIIALTANAVSSAREMFLSEGFDGFVPKPIEISELERVLKRELPKSMIRYEEGGRKAGRIGDRQSHMKEDADLPQPEDTGESGNNPARALQQAGIRTSAGLRYCMNDREFYRSLLKEFGQSGAEKRREIRALVEAQDWKGYAIRVHGLKSNARMIGAERLSEMAKALETAAKAGLSDEIALHGEETLALYEETSETIRRVYGLEDEEQTEEEEILEFLPVDSGEDQPDQTASERRPS